MSQANKKLRSKHHKQKSMSQSLSKCSDPLSLKSENSKTENFEPGLTLISHGELIRTRDFRLGPLRVNFYLEASVIAWVVLISIFLLELRISYFATLPYA